MTRLFITKFDIHSILVSNGNCDNNKATNITRNIIGSRKRLSISEFVERIYAQTNLDVDDITAVVYQVYSRILPTGIYIAAGDFNWPNMWTYSRRRDYKRGMLRAEIRFMKKFKIA